ncbi:VOC family protein [Roseovarius sp. 2305UL8-3]|uniref:VOC family protein n=1 Tax=Roseovarius conchicola TaxID=3121636 RepID=UPI003528C3C1
MTITSSIPVLRGADYPRAKAFWVDTMGFSVAEEGGDPPRFGIFRRDQATVFVDTWKGADPAPSPTWRAYFHVGDVDTFAAGLPAGTVIEGPRDAVYGMREIEIVDPDGNRLCFGADNA